MEVIKTNTISKILIKVIVVNIINLVVLVGIFILIPQLNQKALDVKTERSKAISATRALDSSVIKADIDKQMTTINTLKNAVSGDSSVITFIQNMDNLKKAGTVTSYEFPTGAPVPDKYSGLGLPVGISMTGNTQNISDALIAVSKIPLVIRPVTLEISKTASSSGEINAKYGGFLYIQ